MYDAVQLVVHIITHLGLKNQTVIIRLPQEDWNTIESDFCLQFSWQFRKGKVFKRRQGGYSTDIQPTNINCSVS